MSPEAILLPMCALALLTFAVLTLVPLVRIRAARTGRVHVKDFRYGESANVPGDVSLPNRTYMNLLELPVLFYVICLALYATKRVDQTYLALGWAFVASRLLHAIVNFALDNILVRLGVFLIGVLTLLAMWVRFGLSLM